MSLTTALDLLLNAGHNAEANSMYVMCKCGDEKAHEKNEKTPIYSIEGW